jgi:hypothetical protein
VGRARVESDGEDVGVVMALAAQEQTSAAPSERATASNTGHFIRDPLGFSRPPNGLELSCPAEAGNPTRTLGQDSGHDKNH